MTSSLERRTPDTSLKAALRGGDPLAREGAMGPTETAAMKRAAIAAAGDAPARPLIVNMALVAIPLSVVLVLGSSLRESLMTSAGRNAATVHAADSIERARQLYFQTAGGTRVIWIFTPGSDEGDK